MGGIYRPTASCHRHQVCLVRTTKLRPNQDLVVGSFEKASFHSLSFSPSQATTLFGVIHLHLPVTMDEDGSISSLESSQEQEERHVWFFSRVSFYTIPSHHDLTKQEKRRIWFDDSDIVSINGARMETLSLMETGILTEDDDDNDEYSTRGLCTRKENRKRFEIVKDSRETVLLVQEIQQEDGYSDAGEIAFSYFKMTYASCLDARDQGKRDQEASQNELFFSTTFDADHSSFGNDSEHSSKDSLGRQRSLTDIISDSPKRVRLLLEQRV